MSARHRRSRVASVAVVSLLASVAAAAACSKATPPPPARAAQTTGDAGATSGDALAWVGTYEVDCDATYAKVAPGVSIGERAGLKISLTAFSPILPVVRLDADGRFETHAAATSYGGTWQLKGSQIVTTTDTVRDVRLVDMASGERTEDDDGRIVFARDGSKSTVPAVQAFAITGAGTLVDLEPRGPVLRRK